MDEEDVFEKLKQGRPTRTSLAVIDHEETAISTDVEGSEDDQETEDIKTSIKNVIELGDRSMATLADLAEASEHPRAYEVLANLMKTVVDANKTLFDIKKGKKGLSKIEEDGKRYTQINNDNRSISLTPTQFREMLKDGGEG